MHDRVDEVNLFHAPLVFPRAHRGDPPPRQSALAHLGFRWRQWAWRRGRVVLTDEAVDTMPERQWQQCIARWDRRRPTPRRRTHG